MKGKGVQRRRRVGAFGRYSVPDVAELGQRCSDHPVSCLPAAVGRLPSNEAVGTTGLRSLGIHTH